MKTTRILILCGALLAAATSCEDKIVPPDPEPVPTVLIPLTPIDQSATVGSAVVVRVRVLDADGKPMPGVNVSWTVSTGGGTAATPTPTDGNGDAFTAWQLGSASGTQQLVASVNELTRTFSVTTSPGTVASIVLAPATPSVEAGATLQLSVSGRDAFGNTVPAGGIALFSSNDTQVATVNNTSGVVTGVTNGTATITATVGSLQATTALTVTAGTPGSVTLTPTPLNLFAVGDTARFTAVVRNTRNAVVTAPLTWSSSNTGVATVNPSTGLITAVSEGATQITASAGGNAVTTATVNVSFSTASITPSPGSISPTVLRNQRTLVTAIPRNRAGQQISAPVTWTSSNVNVAEVHPIDSVSAYVYTTGFGTATISISSGLVRAELPVRVELGVVHAVIFPQEVRIHAVNGTAHLRLQAYSASGTIVQPQIVWESSNPAVATVTTEGIVTARSNGTTEVRAVVNGVVAATRTVTVEATPTAPVLSFSTPSLTFYRPGEAYTLTAVRRGATNEAVGLLPLTVATGNAAVVTIDQNLLLRAVGAGAANVSASADNQTATAVVRVLGNPASMVVAPPSGTLILNGGINATMVVVFSVRDATGETIPFAIPTFTSSDPSIVRAFGNQLHAMGKGTVTITASYAGLPDYQFQVVVQ